MKHNFVALILTHGRPDRVQTYQLLRRSGYSGPIVIVIDDKDATADQYRERYGPEVYQFSKEEIGKTFDSCDNFDDHRTITYARNAAPGIAKELGYEYSIQLDDDYTYFAYRANRQLKPVFTDIKDLDSVFDAMVDFLEDTGAAAVAMAQAGDFIGGTASKFEQGKGVGLKRKCMNSFITATARPVYFLGRMNEDVCTYVSKGMRGELFLTVMGVSLGQKATQSNAGGITELYKSFGTYVKSFYTVMNCPSCTTVAMMGDKHFRLHHRIEWNNAVPKIVPESIKKNA